jgi:hypothetical protein
MVDYVAFDHVKRLAKFQPFNSPADPLSELPPRRRKKIFMQLAIEVLQEFQYRNPDRS